MTPADSWAFLPFGYLGSVLIEMPILLFGLSARHSLNRRIFAAFWLTACTYPTVVLVLPQLFDLEESRFAFLLVAETFAPLAECALFWIAFDRQQDWQAKSMWRDMFVIVLANLASFGAGELYYWQFGQ